MCMPPVAPCNTVKCIAAQCIHATICDKGFMDITNYAQIPPDTIWNIKNRSPSDDMLGISKLLMGEM